MEGGGGAMAPGGAGAGPGGAAGGVTAWRERGNRAFRAGRAAEAEAAYAAALAALAAAGGGAGAGAGAGGAEERGALLSNRSAARLARGDAAGALDDAEASCAARPRWGKAWLRVAAAREAAGGVGWGPAALEAALEAQERDPSAASRQAVVRLVLMAAGEVRVREGASPALPGVVPSAGDVRADCWPGEAVGRALSRCCQCEDRWVKCAGLLQLAALAAAPEHKPFFAAGGLDAFAECAASDGLDARFPPRGSLADACPAFPAAVQRALGRPYEAVHPLAICALGYANFLRYADYCPNLDAVGSVAGGQRHLKALGKVASDAQMCALTVGLLGQALRSVTAAVEAGGKPAILTALDSGLPETVERLARACREMDMAPEERALQRLYHRLWKHPDHPDNQVEAA